MLSYTMRTAVMHKSRTCAVWILCKEEGERRSMMEGSDCSSSLSLAQGRIVETEAATAGAGDIGDVG